MNKNKWLIAVALSVAYALILSVGMVCFQYLFGVALTHAVFGGVIDDYPRFIPFCVFVGLFALVALFVMFYIDLRLSKKFNFSKIVWCVKIICAFIISILMIIPWHMLFELLRKVY